MKIGIKLIWGCVLGVSLEIISRFLDTEMGVRSGGIQKFFEGGFWIFLCARKFRGVLGFFLKNPSKLKKFPKKGGGVWVSAPGFGHKLIYHSIESCSSISKMSFRLFFFKKNLSIISNNPNKIENQQTKNQILIKSLSKSSNK